MECLQLILFRIVKNLSLHGIINDTQYMCLVTMIYDMQC